MKFLMIFLVLLFSLPTLARDISVKGYFRKDGTYVAPHHRSSPDSSVNNNWSTQGNYNPYNGKEGTRPRENEYGSSNLGGNSGFKQFNDDSYNREKQSDGEEQSDSY